MLNSSLMAFVGTRTAAGGGGLSLDHESRRIERMEALSHDEELELWPVDGRLALPMLALLGRRNGFLNECRAEDMDR